MSRYPQRRIRIELDERKRVKRPKGPDPGRRPFRKPSKSLSVDLLLQGIPEIVGPERSRATSDAYRRIRTRQQEAEQIYTILLDLSVGIRQPGGVIKTYPSREAVTTYGQLLQRVAASWPSYAESAHKRDLESRRAAIIAQRGEEEIKERQRDWRNAMREIEQWRRYPGRLRARDRRELENELEQPYCAREMLVDIYPMAKQRKAPLPGQPIFVLHRSKTIDSLARKAFIRIVQQMSDKEALEVKEAMRQEAGPATLGSLLFRHTFELDVYDSFGMTQVFQTLADRNGSISNWWSAIAAYNLDREAQGRPADRIRLATDASGATLDEDYADPREAKERPYEAAHKTWLVGRHPEPVEVRYETLWGFATGLALNTRLSHRLYESRKGWQRKTEDGSPWTEAHRAVYNGLLGIARKRYGPLGVHFPESYVARN